MKKRIPGIILTICLVLFCITAMAESGSDVLADGDWQYTISGTEATITGYTGTEAELTLPFTVGADGETEGYSVTAVADGALPDVSNLTIGEGSPLQEIGGNALPDLAVLHVSETLDLTFHAAAEGVPAFLTLQAWYGISGTDVLPEACFGVTIAEIEDGAGFTFADGAATAAYHAANGEEEAYLILDHWTGSGEDVLIPDGFLGIPFREIGEYAFQSGSFGTITISENIRSIGASAFAGVTGDNFSVVFQGSNLTSIGNTAFASSAIKQITIPASVTELGTSLFVYSQLEEAVIQAQITKLPDYTFVWCQHLTSVTLPETLTSIGLEAFCCTNALTELTLPEGLLTLEEQAISACSSLQTVTLPSTLTEIKKLGLANCSALTTVDFSGAEVKVGQQAFDRDISLVSILNAQNITEIGELGFGNCRALTNFTFGEKITSVGLKGLGGNWALKNVSFSGTQHISFGDNAFETCKELETISIPDADIGDNAFQDCIALTGFTLESGTVGSNVLLRDRNVTSVTLGEGVTAIGNSAFQNLTSLTRAEIQGPLTEIPASAFAGCTSLKYLDLPDSLTAIGNSAFDGAGLEALILPDALETIGMNAFRNCCLYGVMRPDDGRVSTILIGEGDDVYYNEDGIYSLHGDVTLPAGLTSIGQTAFSGNSRLDLATMPSEELTLGSQAFDASVEVWSAEPECEWIYTIHGSNCTIIGYLGHEENLIVPSDLNGLHVTAFGDRVFKDMSFLRTIELPHDTATIGQQLFYNCRNLQTASLGQRLGTLPLQTFFSCTSLTDVSYPDNTLTSIEGYAFYNCVSLTDAGIPEGVLSLGDGAFSGCGNMTTAVLPQSLEEMGVGVFADCKSLTEIAIPDGVYWLDAGIEPGDAGSFSGCAALTTVTIGRGLESIASGTFAGLVNLQTVTINADDIGICSGAFSGCVALQEVTIRNAYVGDSAFSGCSGLKRFTMQSGSFGYRPFTGCDAMTSVTLGSGVSSLTESIFSGLTRLENVTMAGNIEYISDSAFSGCTRLASVSLPSTVTSIGSYAFADSGLTRIVLPGNLNDIGYCAFSGCGSLAEVVWNSGLSQIGDYAFQGCAFTELTLPSSVTQIGSSAFAGCDSLARIHLPNYISSIGTDAFPPAARVYCNPSSLTARTLSRAGGSFVVEGEGMEFGIRLLMRGSISLGLSIEKIWTDETEITVPSVIGGELVTELGSGLFTSCPSVQKVTFPTSVPTIPANLCAGNSSLTEITIPEGVTIIAARAFQNCVNLHDVSLPSTVVSIGESAFDGCTLLSEITLSDNIQEIGANAFTSTRVYCALGSKTAEMLSQTGGGFICREYPLLRLRYLFVDGLPGDLEVVGAVAEAVTVNIPDSVTSVADGAFENNTTLTTVNLPGTLTRIGTGAFAGSGIAAITLPDGVTAIPDRAFENTANLRNVTIQGTVTRVGYSAFAGSDVTSLSFRNGLTDVGSFAFQGSGLESCELPDSVTSLGDYAFENCARLVHIDIPAGIRRIENSTFRNTPELKTVNVPAGVEYIGSYAFRDSGLASVTLPDTITTIDYYAFYDCRNLKKAAMAGDMVSIGNSAFQNCVLLNELTMSGTLQTMGSSAFYNCRALKDVVLPRNLVSVPGSAFSNCDSLTHVKISDGTVNIESSAFYSCDSLVSVELPAGLKGIGSQAFEYCKLTSLTIPESVTTIGSSAFHSNRLTGLILPDSVASIGSGAFQYNDTMTSLRLPASLPTVTDYAFYHSGLTNVTIPGGTRALGYQCFAQSSDLTAALIPASVESIDDTAFEYCGYPFTVYCYHGTEAEAFAIRRDYCIIYLDGDNPLEGITISANVTEMTIGVGEQVENLRQYFTIQPEDIPYEYTLQFSAEPEATAMVEEKTGADSQADADLTGLQPGTAILTACLAQNPDIRASITVYVRENITAVTLPDEIWQKKNEPLTLAPVSTVPAGVTEGFTWSINRDVGYIEGNVLYPTAYGSATLTVTAWNGVTASVPLHVYDDPTEVMIRNVPVGLDIGMEASLTPQVRAGFLCTGALAQHFITWSSENEDIATVSSTGRVTAAAYGTATVRAVTDNGIVGTAEIYVSPPVTGFNLEGRVLLPVGGSMVLTATDIEPANANPGAFRWTTSPAGLVSYENGIVTVLTDQACDVTITATPWNDTDGTLAKTTDVTIFRPDVQSVRIDPVNQWNWVPEHGEIQLTAHVETTTGEFVNQLVEWSIANNDYGDYIDRKGILHTSYSGWRRPLIVTATADNGQSGTLYLYVVYRTEDFILPDRITVQTGETVSVDPVNNRDDYYTNYTMSVGTPALAEVSGMNITGRQPGETALTVTSWDGVVRQTRLMIYDPIEEITIRNLDSNRNKFSLSDPQHDLFVQWDYQAHADAVSDKTYRDDLITWTSSDPSIIRVENALTGAFRTVGYGTATLTASAKSGAKASTVLNVRKEVRTFTLAPVTGYVRADVQLTAESIDNADSYDGFVWTVSPASIGTVEGQTLHVAASQPATGTLTATSWDGYVTRETGLTILREPVTSVTIDEYGNGEIGVGGSYPMTARVCAGIDYINELVTWSSSDEQIATVNEEGVVTCVGSGDVTITATADDGTGISGSLTLTGVQGVTDFDILPEEITVFAGESAEIAVANIRPENAVVREFTWAVSPENAAAISDGILTPTTASNTEATVTATSWNGTEKTIPLHIVRPEITGLSIEEVEETYVGTPVQLTAHVTANGQEYENRFIRWESSDPAIAEVDENGLVTPKATGSVYITAYDKVNEMNSCEICLYPQVAVEDFRIYYGSSYADLARTKNSAIWIYATDFTPGNANQNVTYTAVTADGTVIPVERNGSSGCYFYYEGPETTVTVTGTSANGLQRTTDVDVRYNVYGLYTDSQSGAKLALGGSATLPVSVSAANWNDEWFGNLKLTWSSDREDVAAVNESGLVTGVSKGTAHITATHAYTGCSVTIPVKVQTPLTSYDLPGRVKVPVGGSIDLPVNNLQPEGTDAEDLTWLVSPEGIAKIEDGKLVALSHEETTGILTAVSVNGVVRSATLTVYEPWVDRVELEEVGTVMPGQDIQLVAHVISGEEEFINAGVTFRAYVYDNGNGNYDGYVNDGYGAWIDEHTGIFGIDNFWYTTTFYIVASSELSGASDVIEVHAQPGYEDFQARTPLMLTPDGSGSSIQITSYIPLDPQYDYDPDGSDFLTYETDETDLFTVGGCWITANREGRTGVGTVRVRSVNGVQREVQVVVYNTDDISSVTITGVPAYAGTYQNIPLTANLSMYGTTVQTTNDLVSWSSDNPKVASVNQSGVVRTLGYGTANITVTTANGLTDTVAVTVSKEPDNFTLPDHFTVEYGESIELGIATVEPEDATIAITWSVEPAEAASIEGNILTALVRENTTATITAVNWDGSKRTTTLEITYTPPLDTLRLPAMLTEIGEEAFAETVTQQVYIPAGCTVIGARAFADCKQLLVVHIPGSVLQIDSSAFDGCDQLASIRGESGSAAEAFAADHGIPFIIE